MTCFIMGLKMGLLLFVAPCICSFFFLSRFLSKISPKPFNKETSNLVYRFITTTCIVGLKKGLLYLFFPIFVVFFLSLQIFRQRYLNKCIR